MNNGRRLSSPMLRTLDDGRTMRPDVNGRPTYPPLLPPSEQGCGCIVLVLLVLIFVISLALNAGVPTDTEPRPIHPTSTIPSTPSE